LSHRNTKNGPFAKTDSGQTQENAEKRGVFLTAHTADYMIENLNVHKTADGKPWRFTPEELTTLSKISTPCRGTFPFPAALCQNSFRLLIPIEWMLCLHLTQTEHPNQPTSRGVPMKLLPILPTQACG
jgi:hypothetical protein